MSSALEFRTGTQVDAAVVDSFLLNHFRVTEPITSALGILWNLDNGNLSIKRFDVTKTGLILRERQQCSISYYLNRILRSIQQEFCWEEEYAKQIALIFFEVFCEEAKVIEENHGATMDDVTDFFCDLRDGGLHHEKHSILVFDEDQLIAISLNDVKEFSDPSTSNTGEFNPYHDYAEDIAKGPYSQLNANRLVTFVETLEQGMQQLLGNPTHVLKIDVLCVRNDYQGRGIASQLVRRSIDHAENISCSWVVTAATAVASQIVFAKAGFRTIHELPFSCFREDGECVYRCLPDHGRCGKLMAIPVESRNAVQNVK